MGGAFDGPAGAGLSKKDGMEVGSEVGGLEAPESAASKKDGIGFGSGSAGLGGVGSGLLKKEGIDGGGAVGVVDTSGGATLGGGVGGANAEAEACALSVGAKAEDWVGLPNADRPAFVGPKALPGVADVEKALPPPFAEGPPFAKAPFPKALCEENAPADDDDPGRSKMLFPGAAGCGTALGKAGDGLYAGRG